MSDDLAAKKKALQEKLAAFQAEREAQLAPKKAEDEVAQLERQLADEQALADAQDAHGEENVRGVRTASGLVVVKRANHLIFKKYIDKADFSTKALEELIYGKNEATRCLVRPDPDTLDKWLELEPFRLQAVAGAIGILAGAGEDTLSSK